MSNLIRVFTGGLLFLTVVNLTGCGSTGTWGFGRKGGHCEPCGPACCDAGGCPSGAHCGGCPQGCGGHIGKAYWSLCGWAWKKSNAIPETLPLGSTVRAHIQVMETNAEAADFIFHLHEFVGETAELTPDGKDHVLEVAARMRSAPFPVLIERSENNSDPELDALRRNLIAHILTDLGNPDAQQRTVVATPYSPGYVGNRAEMMYYQHIYGGGNNNNNGNNGNFGFSGGGGFGGF